jgi:fatty-acyl-CoA synthase
LDANVKTLPTVLTAIDALAQANPDARAILCGDRALSYGGLSERSRRLAYGLSKLGVEPGDRVAIWLANRFEWIETALACGRLGAIVVCANTRFRALDLGDILERSAAKALLFWPGFPEAKHLDVLSNVEPRQVKSLKYVVTIDDDAGASRLASLLGKTFVAYERLLEQKYLRRSTVAPQDPWVLFTTSGTTQKPKFVMHSHTSVGGHAQDFARAHLFGHGTVLCVPHPVSGVLGFTPTFSALAAGAPVVLISKFDGAFIAAQMLKHRVTNLSTIDQGLLTLLNDAVGEPIFPDFRFAMFGALNAQPEDCIRIADARGFRCVGSYGMTEVHAGFTLQRVDGSPKERAPGGGFAISPKARMRIVDIATRQALPAGQIGELEISTPNIMLGYFRNEEATRAAFTEDGFLRTGDSGFLLPDGSFRFIARLGDTLRLSGFLVSPVEISSCVETHPSVLRCEVVGRKQEAAMKAIAFVILKEGACFDPTALADFCRSRLAAYKVPAKFVAIEAFPTTEGPNGPKVQRAKLREMAQELNV